ncbi:MAG: EAL domain-containing protein, partial [Gammaproteobacteria bacterium]|nr:EAL domain-containing protein [Gammaproteobacteria bacterium]
VRNNNPIELILQSSSEKRLYCEATFALAAVADTELTLISLRDITAQKHQEQQVKIQANFDALTGLPNRALFLDRLEHELVRAERNRQHTVLMFIDLDRFKWVNDTLGHAAGDQLLCEASRRLNSCVRQSDTVARLGGDEFTIILPDMVRGPDAERVTKKILSQLTTPFSLQGQEAHISGSIGIAVFPDNGHNSQELIKNADTAMYRAKEEGRSTYRFFTEDMQEEVAERIALEKELNQVLQRQQLVAYYQPIIDIREQLLVGAESFLRWQHPERGLISPHLFLTIAEEIGLSLPFTNWILEEVCRQGKMWRDILGLEAFTVSVNLSCSRCHDLLSKEHLGKILEQAGLPPSGLILEITEQIVANDELRATKALREIKDLGVGLWLDDFGTGNSSLSLLQRLPVDGVKVDQSFISAIHSNESYTVLIEAMMTLASTLRLEVVGEGVESEDQEQFLRDKGCYLAQGYYFGTPMPAAEFAIWAKEYQAKNQSG